MLGAQSFWDLSASHGSDQRKILQRSMLKEEVVGGGNGLTSADFRTAREDSLVPGRVTRSTRLWTCSVHV
jgi:hypothetical protein